MPTTRRLLFLLAIILPLNVLAASDLPRPAPEFNQPDPNAWVGSPPLTWAELRGRVVLIDFWAFECWNCYRSFPWLNAMHERLAADYGDAFLIIGVHTPEFAREKSRSALLKKVAEFKPDHPVMMDNDYAYWRAMGNRYWPAWYLIDREGQVRYHFIGETHEGDARAVAIEAALRGLLDE